MSIPDNFQPLPVSETLAEKTGRLLENQVDLAIGVSGVVSADNAEAIFNLACAYRELTKAED